MLVKKRDSAVNVNSNGFALFVIGLTLAGFLGGALRLVLNSDRAQQEILLEVQKKFPEWQVESARVELHLAAGIWPGFTVELPEAHAQRAAECGKPLLDVELHSLKIPVSLWTLVTGANRVGKISADRIDIELKENPCETAAHLESDQQTATESTAIPAQIQMEHLGLRQVYDEIRERAQGVTLNEIHVRNSKQPSWNFSGRGLRLTVSSDVRIYGDFTVSRRFPKGEIKQDFKLIGALHGPLLEWELKSPIKEGELRWSGQLDEEGRTFLQRIRLHQGPLNDILEILFKAEIIKSFTQTRRAWVDCELTQGGSFQKSLSLAELPIRIDSCRVDGELGRLYLEPQMIYPVKPHFRNGPVQLKVSKLSLEMVSEFFGLRKFPLLIASMGFWTGTVTAYDQDDIEFSGELESLKLNFSNKSLRGVETLSQIQTQGERKGKNLKVTFSDFQILGGSRGGIVKTDYNLEKGSGRFVVDFNSLRPSEPLQNLLFQGRVDALKLNLNGALEADGVHDVHGRFSSEKALGRGWEALNVSGEVKQIKKENFALELQLETLKWSESFKYDVFSTSLLNAFGMESASKQIDDSHINMEVHVNGGVVNRAVAKINDRRLEFVGEWKRGRPLYGKARIGSSKNWLPVEINHLTGQVLKSL